MLVDELLCELLLIITKLVLIEVEFLVGGDIGWPEFLGKDILRVDPSDPGMEEHLFQPFHGANPHLWVFMQQTCQ